MIQIVENNIIRSMDITYEALVKALDYHNKERERHRVKARRLYRSKHPKIEPDENHPVHPESELATTGTSA